jgi:uncharacterized protein (DUF2336 family)
MMIGRLQRESMFRRSVQRFADENMRHSRTSGCTRNGRAHAISADLHWRAGKVAGRARRRHWSGTMSSSALLIGDLEQAIVHGTDAIRVTALRQVTDLFVSNAGRLAEDLVDLFDDVMQRLIEHIETRALIELSERLAPIGNAPSQVVRRLAFNDDIAVARPVLAASERISEADLVAIAETKGQGHMLAISDRKQLSEPITGVLVTRGDDAVARNVAGNQGARFSPHGIAMLADRAERDRALADRLVLRADIPLHVFCRLLARATDVVVRRLGDSAPPDDQADIRRVVTRIAGEVAADAETPRNYAAALRSVLLMHAAGLLDEHKLLAFAGARRLEQAVAALSLLCSVPIEVADRVIFSEHVEPLLILCRAADLKWPTVRAVIQLRPRDYHVPSRWLAQVWEDFQRFSPSTAKAVVNHWRARESSAAH